MEIRAARPDDAEALAEIYAFHVLHGTGTFEEDPPSPADMGERLAAVQARGWPWLVAEAQGEIVGYAYAAQLRDRMAYRFSAESSVYVREDRRGGGVGGRLLAALLHEGKAAGFRRMFAIIGDAANMGSITLHARHGFEQTGVWHKAGCKFGRWLDVIHMQREL